MSVTSKLEINIEQVKKFIRDLDRQLADSPDDVSLAMSRQSMANHLEELEQKLAEAEKELATAH